MAIRLGEKPLTNAEKQKRYRARKRADGLLRRDLWTDMAGFITPPTEQGTFAAITFKELRNHLNQLLAEVKEWNREIVYAEILEYAKKMIPKFKKVFAEADEELNKLNWNDSYR
jgi:hypothetical protein